MSYVITEYRHQLIEHANLAGHHHYDIALVIQKHEYGGGCPDSFVPLVCDANRDVLWQGYLTRHRNQAVRQFKELFPNLAEASGIVERPPVEG